MKHNPKKVIKIPICDGINKAKGFDGCKKETHYRTNGLCDSCLIGFYFNDERGKIIYAKLKGSLHHKKEKAFKSDLRQKLKTLGDYEAEAKKSFQKWIRMRDEHRECISCGVGDNNLWDGGHYFKAELFSGLIFNENNCHKQCRKCNRFLNGNEIQYRFGLIARYGIEFVENLESISNENRVYKYSKDELIEIKKTYDLKIKQLTNPSLSVYL
jgi:hypothetical protein